MTSIKLVVTGAKARAEVDGVLTSGMVGIPVTIEYDDAWQGLTKNLVCRCSHEYGRYKDSVRTITNIGASATVAHEVMHADMYLYLGIEGYSPDGRLIVPTTWAKCSKILPGANINADRSADPTLPVWARLENEITQLKQNTVSDKEIVAIIEKYLEENPVDTPDSGQNANQGTGLTATEKNLMLTLFKAVPYQSDVSAAMKSLEAIWNSSSGGDSGDNGGDSGVTYHSVTYNLTSVTADSSASSVVSGGSLTVNLIPDTNVVLSEVVVTMDGVDVTATAYSNGKISISSVTGDVVITATATVANYTQVEYLETTASTAYMVTPCTLQPTDLVECIWSNMLASNWAFPFGAYGNNVHCSLTTRPDGVVGRTSYTRRSGATYMNRNAADASFAMPVTSAMYRFTESAPGTGTIYDADGNALVTLTDESVSGYSGNGTVMGLFYIINADGTTPTMHGANGTIGLRIHSFKITDVYGVATLDLIPVLDENEIPCMYDKVSGEFIYDASGNNTFTAGGAV